MAAALKKFRESGVKELPNFTERYERGK